MPHPSQTGLPLVGGTINIHKRCLACGAPRGVPMQPPMLGDDSASDEPYNWHTQARANQRLPEGNWFVWLILAGRGFGKTRTGAESIRHWVHKKRFRRLALIAENERDARQVMVEGSSGILSVSPPQERPTFFPSRGELVWPNGAVGFLFSSQSYERLRGPQFECAWIDEFAKFSQAKALWDQLMFALRLGTHPQIIITTTPRPLDILQEIMADPQTLITRGSTYENKANLPPAFIKQITNRYGGTPLGQQEIMAEIVNPSSTSLWSDPIHIQRPTSQGL